MIKFLLRAWFRSCCLVPGLCTNQGRIQESVLLLSQKSIPGPFVMERNIPSSLNRLEGCDFLNYHMGNSNFLCWMVQYCQTGFALISYVGGRYTEVDSCILACCKLCQSLFGNILFNLIIRLIPIFLTIW